MAQVTESLISMWLRQIGNKDRPQYTLNEFAQLCHAWSQLQRCRAIMECNDPGNAREIFGPPASAPETGRDEIKHVDSLGDMCICLECVEDRAWVQSHAVPKLEQP